jgi:hypothetical protein
MKKLDAKFEGTVRKVKDGSFVSDDQWCVFLAQDTIFSNWFPGYIAACIAANCDEEQVISAYRMYRRIRAWREAHPEKCKIPDAHGERLLGTETEPNKEESE